MKLHTSDDEYDEIVALSQKGRTRIVELPRKVVRKVVLDHQRMVTKLSDLNEQIESGKPPKGT